MSENAVRIGVVGCGGFGLFALQNFTQIPGAEVVGMSESYGPAADAAAAQFGIGEQDPVEKLVARDDVDIIYIATPPFLHHPQAMIALRAGKHVISEKPFALNLEQADEMIGAARDRDLLVVANLLQRYNPLYDAVNDLIDSKLLGEPLHGYFENYAKDEQLPPDHWFWDRSKSGGIFIEHGVHFFDMFAGWFGPGEVVAAQRTVRPGTTFEEQLHCSVRYGETLLVNFYHGFHQAERMDRQEMRLVFERGDVTLYEWVPTRVRIDAIADEKAGSRIAELFPGARVDVTESYSAGDRVCYARHNELDVSQRFELTCGEGVEKMTRYGELLRAIFEDQMAWIRDGNHVRKITEENGRASLAMAVEADLLAHRH
jgi:predicted dehydrogenase